MLGCLELTVSLFESIFVVRKVFSMKLKVNLKVPHFIFLIFLLLKIIKINLFGLVFRGYLQKSVKFFS